MQNDAVAYRLAARPTMGVAMWEILGRGYETIFTDPAPGFHPRTFGGTEAERQLGLKRLYAKLGLRGVRAKLSMESMVGQRSAIGPQIYQLILAQTAPGMPRDVMFGNVDTVMNKLVGGILLGAAFTIAGFFRSIYDVRRISDRVHRLYNETTGTFNAVPDGDAVPALDAQEGGSFYELYNLNKRSYIRL